MPSSRFLNPDAEIRRVEETGLAFEPFFSLWLIVGVAFVVFVFSALAYHRTSRPLAPALKKLLIGLRFGAVAVLLLCLLRPSLQTIHHELSKRPLLLLMDRSDSMTRITDTPQGESRWDAVRDLLRQHGRELSGLEERYEVIRLQFARALLTDPAERSERDTIRSAYGRSLQQGFREVAGSRCDAVVIFGDGSHNFGPPDPMDVASAMAQQGVPIYTLGVGQDAATAQVRDVKLVELKAPSVVPLYDKFTVRSRLACRGCSGQEVTVRFEFPGREAQETTVKVSHPEEVVPLEFEAVPEEEGEFKLKVSAKTLPGELLDTNNASSSFVKVVREGLRVAFYDRLRPEAKFLVRSLATAEELQVRHLLALPGRKLPDARADIEKYDVIILGDLKPAAFPPGWPERLKRAVQQRGKGLVALPGPEAWGAAGWPQTPVRDLLPIRIVDGLRRDPGERPFLIATAHASHPALSVGEDRQATLRMWKALPPVAGAMVGAEARRAALVLARDENGNPLLTVQRTGSGRAACVTGNGTFRWFFTALDTQDHHRKFWRQIVLWAAGEMEEKEAKVRAELERQRVAVGEQVSITVKVVGPEDEPINDADVELSLERPDRSTKRMPAALKGRTGTYRAEYTPRQDGDYELHAEARRNAAAVGEDRVLFHATAANPELEDPVANLKLLRRMAAATEEAGGRYYSYQRGGELFRALREAGRPLKLTTRRRADIWDNAGVFVLFLLLIGTEWGLRKWKDLV